MQLNVRIDEETRRMLDVLAGAPNVGYSEGESVRRGVRMLYNELIGPVTNEQLHEMAREALENWDFDAADEYYKPAKRGLRSMLKRDFREDEIAEHVKGPADWDGLQEWVVFLGQ